MKKNLAILILTILTIPSFSQINNLGSNTTGSLHFGNNGVLIKYNSGDRALMELHSPNGQNRLLLQSLSNASYLASFDGKPLLLQTSGGNVGIGTNTVDDFLHMKKVGANSVLKLENTGDGNASMIKFSRERMTGEDVVGGAIGLFSNTSTNWSQLFLNARSGGADVGVDGSGTQIPFLTIGSGYSNNPSIGINTISPDHPLDVNGSARFGLSDDNGLLISRFTSALADVPGSTGGIQFQGPVNSHLVFDIKGNDINDGFYIRVPSTLQANPTVNKTAFVVKANEKVGIGTNTPTEKFHISGSGLVRSLVESSDNHAYYVVEGAAGKGSFVDYYRKGDGRIWHTGLRNGNNNFEFRLNDQSMVLALKQDGNVGIGTTTTGTHKLAVEGTIGARGVKIEATGWSDFVFEKDYSLRTLDEVENYIAKNKHLPEVPSEQEVIKNGIDIGEMDAKLLQKIEELTLYVIELNKQNQAQQKEIELLKNKIEN